MYVHRRNLTPGESFLFSPAADDCKLNNKLKHIACLGGHLLQCPVLNGNNFYLSYYPTIVSIRKVLTLSRIS